MRDVDDDEDCLSCRVIGSVVPLCLSGYVVHTWWKKVVPTGKLFSSAVYLTFAGGLAGVGTMRMFSSGPFDPRSKSR